MIGQIAPDISPQILAAREGLAAKPGQDVHNQKLRQKAEDFESVFMTEALKTMFSGLATDGPFGGGFGEEMFREFLIDEYAGSIVKSGGVGIADEVYRQMLALQEVEQ